ncbi:MAG: PGPGW domain-containing protein [Desulfobacterales bacterium]|nr:PGPGW domain-containing protein [Desulfobacterales bacterium]
MARRLGMKDLYKKVRRLVIGVIGFTVLLIGIVMIATPGPSILVIPPWPGDPCH